MTNKVIEVQDLSKIFEVKKHFPKQAGFLKNLFFPVKEQIYAVRDLNFSVSEGEKIAFIGPNGAGKSTTIKILTGILYPTTGNVRVLDEIPWKNRKKLGFNIGVVFGQRTQLWHRLAPIESFTLLAKLYELDSSFFHARLKDLVAIFEIEDIINKPVSKLSLGQRMRCEIVASLLHNPKIIFLDEPTIGLDLHAKLTIREVLNKLVREYGTTLFLTSHDTADIEQVTDRVMIIDKGTLALDSSLADLKLRYNKRKILTLITDEKAVSLDLPGIKYISNANHQLICELDLNLVSVEEVIQKALKISHLKDVAIENRSMEKIVSEIYANL